MLEYPSFCYLQNHKTGSTFVESFLRQFCAEPLLSYKKHAVVTQHDPAKFYFVNVREPLSLYRSLYTYGVDGKGLVFERLTAMGLGGLYDDGPEGFGRWLEFVMRIENAPLLSEGYTRAVAQRFGFMTWRFLRLACFGFEASAPTLGEEAAGYIKRHLIANTVLKQEQLREGLRALASGRLAPCLNDPVAALRWLDEAPDVNVTMARLDGLADSKIASDQLRSVRQREHFLYSNFYPGLLQANEG